MSNTIALSLPWCPSVNSYWQHRGRGTFISDRGIAFRNGVAVAVAQAGSPRASGRLAVWIELHPPTRRAFDVDNFSKGILDALVKCGVIEDDGQIDWLACQRGELIEDGEVRVFIAPASMAPTRN